MKKPAKLIILPALCSILIFIAAFTVNASTEKVLVSNENHYISYWIVDENVIFNMESVNDFTDDLSGKFPKADFFSIDVDFNRNSAIDRNIDLNYAIKSGKVGICTSYLFDSNASSLCGKFKSEAYVEISFRGTKIQQKSHPIYRFTIPKSELTDSGDTAYLVFTCFSADKGYTNYPAFDRKQAFNSVSNAIKVPL